ncbi:30S ribosomal protein S4 [Candidatus Dojkabacteria bacterium]|nr:30S ribosomal protein S4 [Candidatus Dojkabacteria bacterium]
MAREIGSKCKLCRREQTKLFLKGERCYTDKCSLSRRQSLPGKSTAFMPRMSNYAVRLREKQKVKRMYGITERQMKNYFKKAAESGGDKGLKLLQYLEMRLDNVVYLLGLAPSRASARQLVSHGKIKVSGRKVRVPSYIVTVGETIEVSDSKFSRGAAPSVKPPKWLKKSSKGGEVTSEPTRDMMDEEIKEYLIIEYYSR